MGQLPIEETYIGVKSKNALDELFALKEIYCNKEYNERIFSILEKHIDLADRRILKGEKIPHEEKLFSIFETYTEWVKKGKSRPNVELGKKLAITTDQFDLIVDYQLMSHQQDRDIVIELENRGLDRCPDRGTRHYARYISLGVCAYNLKKIGRRILEAQRQQLEKQQNRLLKAA